MLSVICDVKFATFALQIALVSIVVPVRLVAPVSLVTRFSLVAHVSLVAPVSLSYTFM